MIPEVVTFGESMAGLRASGPLRLGGSVQLTVAGAESNVSIGLARLGHQVSWAGRVGADELGALVLRTLRAEGVDVSHAHTDTAGRPTGLIIFEPRLGDLTRVSYYRSGSAGSALGPADVLPALTEGVKILHLTGITPALSPPAADAVYAAARAARNNGTLVCLDVNFRSRLWTGDQARATLRPLLEFTDLLVASDDELPLVTSESAGESTGESAGSPATSPACDPATLLAQGVGEVVIKHGAAGASAVTAEGRLTAEARRVKVADLVGAGDAFVAGYLSARLDGLPVAARLARGVSVAAFAVATHGDWDGLPTRADLDLLASPDGATIR